MKRRLFGTDGIRGTANVAPMTAEIALKVGMAVGSLFIRGDYRHLAVIAKDTRLSGYMIENALTSGLLSAGMDVVLVGPMPTPAVAMLTRSLRADVGVMISASHNPYQDNGIKLFDHQGVKLSNAMERAIEVSVNAPSIDALLSAPEMLGRARRLEDARGRYIEYVKQTFPKGLRLSGLKIVLDCANGAAYHLGPSILWELGADVIPLGVAPNGFNINAHVGAMHPELMAKAVLEHGADIGIALDGDADRVIISDEKGNVIDGDQLLGVIALHQKQMGTLQGNGLVSTHMSNMGLERFLEVHDLHMVRTDVGDRHVADYMRSHGYNVGGEQSGHIILKEYSTTGDGLIAALQVLAVLVEEKKLASQICNVFSPFPQVLKNVVYKDKSPLDDERVKEVIKKVEKKLKGKGRLLVRASGTEPLIRVMAEAEDAALVEQAVDEVVEVVKSVGVGR